MKKNKSLQFITLLSSLVILLSVGLVFLSSQKPDAIVFPAIIEDLSPTPQPSMNTEEPITTDQSVNEKAIGYITQVYKKNGKNYLDIDYIQFLHEQEAKDAMLEDGDCDGWEETCSPPNGYYIRNQNPKIRTFEISSNLQIKLETFSVGPDNNFVFAESISLPDFTDLFSQDTDRHARQVPFWLEVKEGLVTSISEQYLP